MTINETIEQLQNLEKRGFGNYTIVLKTNDYYGTWATSSLRKIDSTSSFVGGMSINESTESVWLNADMNNDRDDKHPKITYRKG